LRLPSIVAVNLISGNRWIGINAEGAFNHHSELGADLHIDPLTVPTTFRLSLPQLLCQLRHRQFQLSRRSSGGAQKDQRASSSNSSSRFLGRLFNPAPPVLAERRERRI
jgi:hypothetical protein